MTSLRVASGVVGHKRAAEPEHELQVSLTHGATTLRVLIEAIVRAEVELFHARAKSAPLLRVLTESELGDGLAAGSVRSGGRSVSADVEPDAAVQTALLAQQDGLFQAIVDDQPVDDLDALVELRDGTRVMFLRLVPLVGG
jgi:hypothetical protein